MLNKSSSGLYIKISMIVETKFYFPSFKTNKALIESVSTNPPVLYADYPTSEADVYVNVLFYD